MNDWLHTFFPDCRLPAARELLAERQAWISQPKKGFLRFLEPWKQVRHLRASSCDFSGDVVRIGQAADLNGQERQRVYQVLRAFMPWRKGPFSVFDIDIDAEWRSERKWNRLQQSLPSLREKIIGDIGCNNGYYMFRMQAHQPAFVLGLEPHIQFYYTFQTLNSFAAQPRLQVVPLGIEHLDLFPACFDILFCMGILYHRADPIGCLRDILQALRPGGHLFLESQVIPGSDPVALFPERTYAKVPGTWFVPTPACLANWLRRAGFAEIDHFCCHPMSSREQRRTPWMVYESYGDFVDPERPDQTIEGYPAPWRAFFAARRPRGRSFRPREKNLQRASRDDRS